MKLTWTFVLLYWDEAVVMAACGAVAVSCFLMLNGMGRRGEWPIKALVYAVGTGAAGIAVGPLFGQYNSPTFFDLLFRIGVALFSVWLTWPYWRELPGLNRRKCVPLSASFSDRRLEHHHVERPGC